MKSNKKLKGFTLVELIIVIAVFSVIMFGALQLMDPIGRIFASSYRQESISASADNIKRYIESNIRYAEYVRITDTAPTHDDLVQFVDDYYNGKFYQEDASGTLKYANGDLYVMRIDNANGGQISQWELKYTAGDICAVGSKLNESNGDETLYLSYTNDFINVPATEDDIESVVTPAFNIASPDTEWAVNRAMYNEYQFNISLGVFELVDGQLVTDTEYYNSYANVDQQIFGQRNFAMTITAYGRDSQTGEVDRTLDEETGVYTYDPGYVYSASLALTNVYAERQYPIFTWVYDTTSGVSSQKMTADAEGNAMLDLSAKRTVSERPFVNTVTNMTESDQIYIIYSFGGSDIIK